MTVAYDTKSAVTTAGNMSWTHTPVGTPKGVLVLIVQNIGITNEVTSVTYGGTALTQTTDSPLYVDAGAEDGTVYAYFLGASVPTGAQTVAVNVNGTASAKTACCITLTAATSTLVVQNTEFIDYTELGTVSNPSVDITVDEYKSAFIAAAMFTGKGVAGDVSVLTGCTEVYERVIGSALAGFLRRSSIENGSGTFTCGWNITTSDEAGILAVAIGEPLQTVPVADRAEETDESRTLSAIKSVVIDRAEETDTARNLAKHYISRVTETDTSRAIMPLTASWPAFSGTRTFIPLSTSSIDSTLSGASSGTVFVLTNQPRPTSTGIEAYTWTNSLPAGVTLRGNPVDAVGQSVTKITRVVTSTVAIGDDCTLRDMFLSGLVSTSFSFSGKAWFENCVMGNTVTDSPPSSSSDYVIFSRCTFISTGDIPLFDDDGVSAGGYYFYDCLFLDNRTSGTSPLIKTFAGDITFVNCTFSTTVTDWLDAAPGATGTVTFTNCVFAGEITDITSLGGVSGSSNWGVTSPALSIGQTTVTNLYLNDSNYWRLTPTNQSPFRAGGTTTARTYAGAMTLDRDCLPYAASTPSAGCFQWKPASSCLYKARSSDPLDGFEFTYGANTLDTTYLSEFSPTLFKSHLDVAAVVRSYVWDLIHPARGYFYTTWDGYYRLFLHAGQFDLTTTSPSSKIFGATTLTAEEDTG